MIIDNLENREVSPKVKEVINNLKENFDVIKEEFINKIKELINKYDFQYITTALREKLPDNIPERDIVIELNDSSDEGLLFGFKF